MAKKEKSGMKEIMEAHARMMATLPVRTHECEPDGREKAAGTLRQRIRDLIAQGVRPYRIPQILGRHRNTVRIHVKAIKRGK